MKDISTGAQCCQSTYKGPNFPETSTFATFVWHWYQVKKLSLMLLFSGVNARSCRF